MDGGPVVPGFTKGEGQKMQVRRTPIFLAGAPSDSLYLPRQATLYKTAFKGCILNMKVWNNKVENKYWYFHWCEIPWLIFPFPYHTDSGRWFWSWRFWSGDRFYQQQNGEGPREHQLCGPVSVLRRRAQCDCWHLMVAQSQNKFGHILHFTQLIHSSILIMMHFISWYKDES